MPKELEYIDQDWGYMAMDKSGHWHAFLVAAWIDGDHWRTHESDEEAALDPLFNMPRHPDWKRSLHERQPDGSWRPVGVEDSRDVPHEPKMATRETPKRNGYYAVLRDNDMYTSHLATLAAAKEMVEDYERQEIDGVRAVFIDFDPPEGLVT